MKKIWIIGMIVLVFVGAGCIRRWEVEVNTYKAPNWTSDGKIVFIWHHYIQKWEEIPPVISEHQAGGTEEIIVYEINNDGSRLRKVAVIDSCEFEHGPELIPISTSSAGDWIVLSIEDWRRGEHYPVIYVLKRNGDSLKEIGSGTYPDFSPDAERIVYTKPNQGIWIMDRDGSNDHCIVPDSNATHPAWSPDGGRIAYIMDSLIICDTLGSLLLTYGINRIRTPDWAPIDTNAVSLSYDTPGSGANIVIVYLSGNRIDTLDIISGNGAYWSPNGKHFVGYDGSWFVINRDGTNKWYLKEKIGGEK